MPQAGARKTPAPLSVTPPAPGSGAGNAAPQPATGSKPARAKKPRSPRQTIIQRAAVQRPGGTDATGWDSPIMIILALVVGIALGGIWRELRGGRRG